MREGTQREYLQDICKFAIEHNQYLCVEIKMPDQEETELILNKPSSIQNKMEYYCKAYDENLVHCMNKQVKIVKVYSFDKNANVLNTWENK